MRLSNEERRIIKDWLAEGAPNRYLRLAQGHSLSRVTLEASDPSLIGPSFDTVEVVAHELIYPGGRYRQQIAYDIHTDEPVVFGEVRRT